MTHNLPPKSKKQHITTFVPPNAIEKHSSRIAFSFHFLNLEHAKFNINSKETNYFKKFIDRLKVISGIEKKSLSDYSSKTLRFHPIKWEDTSEQCFGIPDEGTTVEEPMQFSLSANEHGRVHGFFIGNIFYIVWLDPNHKLYTKK